MDLQEAIRTRHSVRQFKDKMNSADTMAKKGPFTKLDLGIVKYNFEAASGKKCI